MHDAIECLENEKYDVVLTDLYLPDIEGFKVVNEIQKYNSKVPIVVLSGEENDQIALEIVQSGAQDYLIKGQGDGHLISRSIEYAIERKRIEHGISFLAQYDSLTGLANRVLFKERLNRALIRADRNKTMVALMFIDLDGFKGVNDKLGHDIGDEVLKEVADAIKAVVRESDIVGRFGGDEFIVSINDINSEKDIDEIASKLNRTVGNVRALDNTGQKIQASIGVIVSTVKQSSPESLIKMADKMMYKAKSAGKGCYKILEV